MGCHQSKSGETHCSNVKSINSSHKAQSESNSDASTAKIKSDASALVSVAGIQSLARAKKTDEKLKIIALLQEELIKIKNKEVESGLNTEPNLGSGSVSGNGDVEKGQSNDELTKKDKQSAHSSPVFLQSDKTEESELSETNPAFPKCMIVNTAVCQACSSAETRDIVFSVSDPFTSLMKYLDWLWVIAILYNVVVPE